MHKLLLWFNNAAWLVITLFMLNACSNNSYQNLQKLNQSINNAQRSVEYAKSVKNIPSAERQQILKNAGEAAVQQNPALREAQETIRATKELSNSVKGIKE